MQLLKVLVLGLQVLRVLVLGLQVLRVLALEVLVLRLQLLRVLVVLHLLNRRLRPPVERRRRRRRHMRRRRRRHIAKFALVVTEPFEDPLLERRLESLVVQTRLSTELFELGDSELLDARAARFVCIVRKWVGIVRLFRSLDHLEGIRRTH